ncbi:Gfo/Idh/MocA family protein [Allorhizocola rhizosphaerae]|uniref:Gfo/Idh/MocA family protein n=1 Tax=Allorhizocola rhizosphaerae TaxID=1872709 RepID=UPI001B8D1FA6|nr:Gfo/Idh/MocA family oxidoreductase [Allorhizocola rhizosphaerae]
MVLIALAGLATSHPYTDALTLQEHAELAVWEPDPQRLARFRAEHPSALVFGDLATLLDAGPSGVVLTVPTPRVAGALERVLARDLPCFVNKPAAATAAQLAALEPVVAQAPHRVLSSSVLRFAPQFVQFRPGNASIARVAVRHSVRPWAEGLNPWQDDPDQGGGTLVTMGIHGVELLVALFGPHVSVAGAATATHRYPTLRSEDTAVLALRWADGPLGVVEVLGAVDDEAYEVVAGDRSVVLRSGDDPVAALGYRGTVEAFLRMVSGEPSPVPWAETRAVLATLIDARRTERLRSGP